METIWTVSNPFPPYPSDQPAWVITCGVKGLLSGTLPLPSQSSSQPNDLMIVDVRQSGAEPGSQRTSFGLVFWISVGLTTTRAVTIAHSQLRHAVESHC